MPDVIASDRSFSEQQRNLLAALVDMMIPAGEELPSAADPQIFTGVLARLAANEAVVAAGLAALEALTAKSHQGPFAALGHADRDGILAEFKPQQPAFVQLLQACVIASYYQDDRVLVALGLPARAPHPGGYEIEATDWSLLDPVRTREPFYRTPLYRTRRR